MNGLPYYYTMLMTQHFHFSIGCLIVSKVQSESEMPSVIDSIIITARIAGMKYQNKYQWGENHPETPQEAALGWDRAHPHRILSPNSDRLGINRDRVLLISVCTFNQFFCSFQQDVNYIPVQGIWFKSAETENNQDL